MSKLLSIRFYLKNCVKRKNGESPVIVKFSCDGMAEFLSHVSVKPELWSTLSQRAKGYSNEAKTVNEELDKISEKLRKIKKGLEDKDKNPTAVMIRDLYVCKGKKGSEKLPTLVSVFEDYIKSQNELVAANLLTRKTVSRYELTLKRLKAFLSHKYNLKDIDYEELNFKFIENFEHYLLTQCKLGRNTVSKPLKYLKKIVQEGVKLKVITSNPFVDFKVKSAKAHREFLTDEELMLILNKPMRCARLERVRDAFIFSCFTGLAFSDMDSLTRKDIYIAGENEYWLITYRNKTDVKAQILLTEIPVALLKKYRFETKVGKIFPVATNQKVNEYLKDIADLCGIGKDLTYHMARHTFATTVTLEKGVPIETVQKMLGHADMRTTQIYAKITRNKIKSDMEQVSGFINEHYKAII